MNIKNNKQKAQDDWWLDRWLNFLLKPLLLLSGSKQSTRNTPKKPSIVKVPYGSSELCYCESGKKYKHCCKKINKKEGKVAIKMIRTTKKGTTTKVKIIKQSTPIYLFKRNYPDSGMDASDLL